MIVFAIILVFILATLLGACWMRLCQHRRRAEWYEAQFKHLQHRLSAQDRNHQHTVNSFKRQLADLTWKKDQAEHHSRRAVEDFKHSLQDAYVNAWTNCVTLDIETMGMCVCIPEWAMDHLSALLGYPPMSKSYDPRLLRHH